MDTQKRDKSHVSQENVSHDPKKFFFLKNNQRNTYCPTENKAMKCARVGNGGLNEGWGRREDT